MGRRKASETGTQQAGEQPGAQQSAVSEQDAAAKQEQTQAGAESESEAAEEAAAKAAEEAAAAEEAEAKAAAKAKPAKAKPAKEEEDPIGTLVPMDNGSTEATQRAIALLLEGTDAFGVDPFMETKPRELLAWNFYPGSRVDDTPDRVTFVTSGGMKITYLERARTSDLTGEQLQVDEDTEERLATLFKAFRQDPITKGPVRIELPADLALPATTKTGQVPKEAKHRLPKGYLGEGGSVGAKRRERAERLAAKLVKQPD